MSRRLLDAVRQRLAETGRSRRPRGWRRRCASRGGCWGTPKCWAWSAPLRSELVGSGPAGAAARRARGHRRAGDRARPGVGGPRRRAGADRRALPGRGGRAPARPAAGRGGRAAAGRRPALGGRPAAGRHPAARGAAAGGRRLAPACRCGWCGRGRSRLAELVAAGTVPPGGDRLLRAAAGRPAVVPDQRRHGLRQDDAAERLLGLVGPDERIVLAEDSAELRPDHPHVVRLETRPANQEGAGRVDAAGPGAAGAADAAGPAGRRRGARRRGHGSAGRVEHRATRAAAGPSTPTPRPTCRPGWRRSARPRGWTGPRCTASWRPRSSVVLHLVRDRAGRRRIAEVHVLERDRDGLVRDGAGCGLGRGGFASGRGAGSGCGGCCARGGGAPMTGAGAAAALSGRGAAVLRRAAGVAGGRRDDVTAAPGRAAVRRAARPRRTRPWRGGATRARRRCRGGCAGGEAARRWSFGRCGRLSGVSCWCLPAAAGAGGAGRVRAAAARRRGGPCRSSGGGWRPGSGAGARPAGGRGDRAVRGGGGRAAGRAAARPGAARPRGCRRGWERAGSAVLAAARFGGDVPGALREAARQPGAEGLTGVAACWQVAVEAAQGWPPGWTGSRPALRAERDQREELRAQLAGPRATALMLAAAAGLRAAAGQPRWARTRCGCCCTPRPGWAVWRSAGCWSGRGWPGRSGSSGPRKTGREGSA